MFAVIYGQVDAIGDWNQGQMLIFFGTFSLINSLHLTIFCFGLVDIPRKIREGLLDLYLTKPGNPLLRLTFENMDPGSALLVLFSAGIIGWGTVKDGVTLTPLLLMGYIGLVLCMTLLWYDVFLILRTLSFFIVSTSAIERLEGDVITLNFKLPGTVYKGFVRILFWTALPYGVMATVPAQWLTGTWTLYRLLYALGVAAFFTVFALWFWRFGLKRYKSASS